MNRAGAIGLGLAMLTVLVLAQAEGGPPPEPPGAASMLDDLGPFVLPDTTSTVGGWYDGPLGSSQSSARTTACGTWTLAVGDAEQTSVRLLHAGTTGPADRRDLAIGLTTVRVAAAAAASTPALDLADGRAFRSAESAAARAVEVTASEAGADPGGTELVALLRGLGAVRELCD